MIEVAMGLFRVGVALDPNELDGLIALELGSGDDRFAGVTVEGVGALFFWKNPAILCCFEPEDVCDFRVGLGLARGVEISLPSMPRAMISSRQLGGVMPI